MEEEVAEVEEGEAGMSLVEVEVPAPSTLLEVEEVEEGEVGVSLVEVEVPAPGTLLEVEIPSAEHACAKCGRRFSTGRGLARHSRYCTAETEADSVAPEPEPQLELDPESEPEAEAEPTLELDVTHLITPRKASFKCEICRTYFKYKANFNRHTTDFHSVTKKGLNCPECPVRCANRKILDKHLQKHKSSTAVSCPECKQTFTRGYHLVRHLEQKGCGGSKRITYACEVCQKPFTRKDNLMLHLRWHIAKHMGDGFCCKKCRTYKAFRSLNTLIKHDLKVHGGGKFECDACGKILQSRIAMWKHLEGVHGEKKHCCDVCDFKCKAVEILRRHMMRHATQKPHQCTMCERSFIQVHELTAHMFKHTGQSSIKCSICGQCFPSKLALKTHEIRYHDSSKAVYCTFDGCNRFFPSETNLRIHMHSHSDEKKFKCPKCDKWFTMKVSMQSHLMTHQFERARRCLYCLHARAYIRGDLLLKHMRQKHVDIFKENLEHVRKVLGLNLEKVGRLTQAETNALISMLDALEEQNLWDAPKDIIMNDDDDGDADGTPPKKPTRAELSGSVMAEEELVEHIRKMIIRLIDAETLEALGWPERGVDEVIEQVLSQCGLQAANADTFTRIQCLRENAKQLFLNVIEDETIVRMMNTKTIDEVIRHVVNASE